MDIRETILDRHKALKRVEELQKFMHGASMLALGLHEDGVIEQSEDKLVFSETIHVFSHILEDVLNGKDVPEAARDVLLPDEDKDR